MERKTSYQSVDLSEIHAVLLEMLKALADFFEQNGLRYSLYCGTLLGAIRHKGFIPWDDDADLVMPLKDYRRFLRLAAKGLPEGLAIQAPQISPNAFHPWARIFKNGTTMLPRSWMAYDTHGGIFVDIYPMIGAFSPPLLRKLQAKSIQLAAGLLRVHLHRAAGDFGTDHVFLKKCLQFVPRFLLRSVSRFLLRLSMRPIEKSSHIGSIDGAPFSGKYDRSVWKQTIKVPFADAEFPAPAEYDRILKIIYGDYMTPVPEWMRVGHDHGTKGIIYDAHRDYREYRSEILQKKEERK